MTDLTIFSDFVDTIPADGIVTRFAGFDLRQHVAERRRRKAEQRIRDYWCRERQRARHREMVHRELGIIE